MNDVGRCALLSRHTRSVELLDAAAAGILLADGDGHLCVVGASNEQTRLLELFQIQNDEGPCLDSFRTGRVVLHSDLDVVSPWPQFSAECTDAGYASVCAVPLRLMTHTLGCLDLFMSEPAGLTDTDVALAQALADVASIAIVHDQATRVARIRVRDLIRRDRDRQQLRRVLLDGASSASGPVADDTYFTSVRDRIRSDA